MHGPLQRTFTKVSCACTVLGHQGAAQTGRGSPDSVETLNSEEEALEQQIMEQLEKEAEAERDAERLHEQTLHEDDLARQVRETEDSVKRRAPTLSMHF